MMHFEKVKLTAAQASPAVRVRVDNSEANKNSQTTQLCSETCADRKSQKRLYWQILLIISYLLGRYEPEEKNAFNSSSGHGSSSLLFGIRPGKVFCSKRAPARPPSRRCLNNHQNLNFVLREKVDKEIFYPRRFICMANTL